MQFNLQFELEIPELPLELDRLLVSFLKKSIENVSPEMFEQLYNKSKSIIKPYSFAYYLPGARFQKDKILLKQNKFSMFFSCADMRQSIYFFNGFMTMLQHKYPMKNNNSMKLINIRDEKRKDIKETEIVIKMQSSLIARRHNKEKNINTYYIYNQEEFSEVVKENIEILLERLNKNICTEGFRIIPVKGKKIVATVFGRKVDANIGIYKLIGTPELLTFLYNAGLGSRRSEGHGLFEVIA